MREQLYLAILSVVKRVEGYFNAKLGEYYAEQNHKYADAFLEKFHEGKPDGTWRLGEPAEWPRKSKPNPYCNHLKGGKSRSKWTVKDYNVALHTFIDGRVKVWCLNNCGFESRPGDANWEAAKLMLDSSSNKASSTERTIITVQGDGRA